MNCHAQIHKDSPKLEPLRQSYVTGEPIEWVRVHDLPGYAYFSHAAHVNRGVGCVECHDRVDRMTVVYQAEPLSMGWCLDCHQNHPSVDENYGTQSELRRAELKDCYTCHK